MLIRLCDDELHGCNIFSKCYNKNRNRSWTPSFQNKKGATMKGDAKLLKTLNDLLADELTAISQLMVHSEMCSNWGYEKLHKQIEKQAIDEMHHAEWLISRILFMEGMTI